MNNFPSCSRRGPGGGKPANRRSSLALFAGEPTPRLYDRVVEVLRTRRYSRRTEQAYIHWIPRFIRFYGRLHDGYDIGTVQDLLGAQGRQDDDGLHACAEPRRAGGCTVRSNASARITRTAERWLA